MRRAIVAIVFITIVACSWLFLEKFTRSDEAGNRIRRPPIEADVATEGTMPNPLRRGMPMRSSPTEQPEKILAVPVQVRCSRTSSPIPDAKIMFSGSEESSMTDLDGKATLYLGYREIASIIVGCDGFGTVHAPIEWSDQGDCLPCVVHLPEAGQISGRVAAIDGDCMSGVRVSISLTNLTSENLKSWANTALDIFSLSVEPDDRGYFRFIGLPLDADYVLSVDTPTDFIPLPNSPLRTVRTGESISLLLSPVYAIAIDAVESGTQEPIPLDMNTSITFEDLSFHAQFLWLDPSSLGQRSVGWSTMMNLASMRSLNLFAHVDGDEEISFGITGLVQVPGFAPKRVNFIVKRVRNGVVDATRVELARTEPPKRLQLPELSAGDPLLDLHVVVTEPNGKPQGSFYNLQFENRLSPPIPLASGEYWIQVGEWQRVRVKVTSDDAVVELKGLETGGHTRIMMQPMQQSETAAGYTIKGIWRKETPSDVRFRGLLVRSGQPVTLQYLPCGEYGIRWNSSASGEIQERSFRVDDGLIGQLRTVELNGE